MTAPPSSVATAPGPAGAAAEEYFDALSGADEARAVALVAGLLDAGVSGAEVLLDLVAPAQVRVGLAWQTGAWSVVREHAATGIAERVVFAVGSRTGRPARRGHVVVGCLDGEWHALPARLVGEVLRMHGWRVTFLGVSVPPAHLVSFLHQHRPDVVALSASVPAHLPAAHRTVVAVQRTGTPVLVGGPGFGVDGRWARRLGVDAWAPTAADAAALLDALPSWPDLERPAAALPDPGSGAEYAGVHRRRGLLVVAAMERLRVETSGAAVALSDSPVDDDLAHVADVLATAAYVGDRELFTDHVRWLAAIGESRGAPRAVVPAALEAFGTELSGCPFARACLAQSLDLLAGAAS